MLALLALLQIASGEPNPPTWPKIANQVFGPGDAIATIEAAVNAAYALNGGHPDRGQFSSHRFVFMFKPGSYDVEVPVGYYTQVLGLGALPNEVIFTSSKGVYSQELQSFAVNPGALNTFWRGAENFQTDATYDWLPLGSDAFFKPRNNNGNNGMLWAASQAAGLRRTLIVSNDLDLYEYQTGDLEAGFASGGFLGNDIYMRVGGPVAESPVKAEACRGMGGWDRSRSPRKNNAHWISKQIAMLGRYTQNRPANLQVDSQGCLTLQNLMDSWGHENGLSEQEVVDAVNQNLVCERTGGTRFKIHYDNRTGDTVIQVHRGGGDFSRDSNKNTKTWAKPTSSWKSGNDWNVKQEPDKPKKPLGISAWLVGE
eukprot:Skav217514  [mRNA]  locus=scaffold647:81908:101585:+ [translate_table: standard]